MVGERGVEGAWEVGGERVEGEVLVVVLVVGVLVGGGWEDVADS